MDQMSIFDLIPQKKVKIHYRDRYGVKHCEDLYFDDGYMLTEIKKWKEEHKDCYFWEVDGL